MRLCVAVVLVTPTSVVEEILLGAARLGLTDGQRAFIHLDTGSALNASSQLAMSIPFISPSALSNSSNADLITAAHALLVLKAHAVSLTNVSATSYKVLAYVSRRFVRET